MREKTRFTEAMAHLTNNRRKFRSQTEKQVGRVREEKSRREKIREEKN